MEDFVLGKIHYRIYCSCFDTNREFYCIWNIINIVEHAPKFLTVEVVIFVTQATGITQYQCIILLAKCKVKKVQDQKY